MPSMLLQALAWLPLYYNTYYLFIATEVLFLCRYILASNPSVAFNIAALL